MISGLIITLLILIGFFVRADWKKDKNERSN